MEEVKYHRDPPAEDKTPRRKSGQNQTRAPSHGRKLKNESSAKQAAGRKLRFGKEDHVMSPEEKRKLLKKKAAHQKAVKAEFALSRVSHKAADEANEDQNAGTEALNRKKYFQTMRHLGYLEKDLHHIIAKETISFYCFVAVSAAMYVCVILKALAGNGVLTGSLPGSLLMSLLLPLSVCMIATWLYYRSNMSAKRA